MDANATSEMFFIPAQLGPEATYLLREVEAARRAIEAATGLQDALAKIRPNEYAWPTKAFTDALEAARRELENRLHEYALVMMSAQHNKSTPAQGVDPK